MDICRVYIYIYIYIYCMWFAFTYGGDDIIASILRMMTSPNGNIFRVTGPLCGEFPTERPVTRSFHVSFDLRLNKRLSKQQWGWWFEAPSWSLWLQCNAPSEGIAHHQSGVGITKTLSIISPLENFFYFTKITVTFFESLAIGNSAYKMAKIREDSGKRIYNDYPFIRSCVISWW